MLEKSSLERRHGVLDGLEPITAAPAIEVRAAAPQARFTLRLSAADAASVGRIDDVVLDQPVNRANLAHSRLAARLGPDEWLLIGAVADAAAFQAQIEATLAGKRHALVDVSHRSVGIDVGGTAAAQVLAAGCPLDLQRFTPGNATRTLLGKAEIVLLRMPATGHDAPLFRVECWRSFGRYVYSFLTEAAREYAAMPKS